MSASYIPSYVSASCVPSSRCGPQPVARVQPAARVTPLEQPGARGPVRASWAAGCLWRGTRTAGGRCGAGGGTGRRASCAAPGRGW